MRHLAEIYMPDSDYDVAELQYGDIYTLDVDLDSILVCIAFAKQTIAALKQDDRLLLTSLLMLLIYIYMWDHRLFAFFQFFF